jgi:hypothetical protein
MDRRNAAQAYNLDRLIVLLNSKSGDMFEHPS